MPNAYLYEKQLLSTGFSSKGLFLFIAGVVLNVLGIEGKLDWMVGWEKMGNYDRALLCIGIAGLDGYYFIGC
ncbi:hypothetical protein A8709_25610 [Paenibacillus pectinilyticus]|uniref:Uncharacterized protein n=1 Tax=Paenibacillus pectinilyticus TaxID=512399 RepID=A0A1C1A114_9BACL|nr:hypothetical protein [Paenibacillus pectinilyticus]OCT14213.1 hypothetical protein A8709_25610 [Paenibacillus pectinilyticus]